MLSNHIRNIKYNRLLLAFSFMLLAFYVKAQTPIQVTAPMTSTPAAGSYFSYSSITLNPGFSFTATTNSSLTLYIANPDCKQLANNFSQNQNYIATSIPRKEMRDFSTFGLTSCDLMQTVQYYDGLGRPLQTVQVNGSAANQDVVQPFVYDQFGREATKYLSYTATTADGSYKPDALTTGVNNFYNPGGSGVSGTQQSNGIVVIPQPFAQTNFEPSPLNRVVEQGAPGTPWQPVAGNTTGHTIKMVYTTNNLNAFSGTDTSVSMRVTLYNATINSNQSRTLTIGNTAGNYYPAGQLYVTVSKDENWKDTGLGNSRGGTTEEYKDKEGHVVLKRTFNYTGGALQMLSTYYIYDDLGNLAFVLPPLSGADAGITSTGNQPVLDNLCYQYQYDERNRLSRKKLPGKGWEYMVYNKLDQVVLSQDAMQRGSNQWTVTKYDALGRVIMTGLWTDASALPQSQLQTNIYNAASQWDTRNTGDSNTGYIISSYPTVLNSSLSINYYDDYSFSNITGFPAKFGTMPSGGSTQTKGLLTASKTNILGSTNMLWDVSYYDGFGRNIQSYKQHYLGGGTPNVNNYDVVTTGYDFTNAITSSTRQHYNTTNTTSPVLTIANLYYYDHMGRKTQTKEQINGGTTVLLSQTDYNEIGQLKTKHLHSTNNGTSFLQNINYAYNERGWLSQVNDPNVAPAADKLFSMALNYNIPVPAHNGSPQYNGNIAEQLYNKGTAGQKYVTYNYDQLNRLIAGNSVEAFSENGITYDANGNIKTMTRFGPNAGTLNYNYGSTNQLASVSGGVTRSYGYDANGNATSDGQGNTITYNLLNLPASIPGKSLTYTYDATGQKLRKISGTTVTEYIDGIQYTGTGIDFVQTEEGRVLNPTSSPNYEYTLTDHLGNNRIAFDQTNGKKSEDDYYPFGLNVPRGTIPSLRNHYLYNKKELQDETGLYDYGARFYDPVIARFTTVDPLATKYPWYTPYQFAGNEVPNAIDRDGLEPAYLKPDGTYTLARDGQLNKPLKGAEAAASAKALHDRTQIGGADSAPGIIKDQTALALGILGPINTLITGENPDGTKANALDYAVAPLMILTSLPMEGGEGPALESSPQLGLRASEIHGAVPTATQGRTTIAVGEGVDAGGNSVRVVGSSENTLRPSQRAMLKPGEVAASGPGHAEVTVINHAANNGIDLTHIGASRPICNACAIYINQSGVKPVTPLKKN